MYIHGVSYSAPLNKYHKLREFLMYEIYSNMINIENIMNLISSKIDCLDITYDANRFTIVINIKKTTMRRSRGYEANVTYYYNVMNAVFIEFFESNPHIKNAARNWIQGLMDDMVFSNLVNIQCIGDKVVEIRL